MFFRVVKLSCPSVNNVIAVGCFMCYTDVIIAGMDQNLVSKSSIDYLCLVSTFYNKCLFSFNLVPRVYPIVFTTRSGGKSSFRNADFYCNKYARHSLTSDKDVHVMKAYWRGIFVIVGVSLWC